MSLVDNIAYPLFGKWAVKHKEYFYRLQKRLRGSHIAIPYDRYVSTAIFCSIIIGGIGAALGYMVANYILAVRAATIASIYERPLRLLIMSFLV